MVFGRGDAWTIAGVDALFPADARYIHEMGIVADSQKDLPVAAELYRRALEAALAKK